MFCAKTPALSVSAFLFLSALGFLSAVEIVYGVKAVFWLAKIPGNRILSESFVSLSDYVSLLDFMLIRATLFDFNMRDYSGIKSISFLPLWIDSASYRELLICCSRTLIARYLAIVL